MAEITYTLKVTYNPPGFHRVTITLSRRGKGVVFETNQNSIASCMARVTEFIESNA